MKRIKKVYPKGFLCTSAGLTVRLDFNPLIDSVSLPEKYVLLHWNRVFRLWGIYDGNQDRYYITKAKDLNLLSLGKAIEIFPTYFVLPTAALLYENCTVNQNGKELRIE